MKNQKLFIAFVTLILFFIACSQAEPDEAGIRSEFAAYMDAVKENNVDLELEYIYAPFFDYFTGESRQLLMGADTAVMFDKDSIETVSEIIESSGKRYALLSYRQRCLMNLRHLAGEGGGSTAINFMIRELNNKCGEDNVAFDHNSYMLKAITHDQMYCIFDPDYGVWKFVYNNEELQPYIEKLIPKEILTKL